MSAWSEGLASPHRYLAARTRWQPIEIVFWIATLLPYVLVPSYLTLASQIAVTALFALSLDLVLGYAGIISLGHAAFFGLGAYSAGLIGKYGLIPEPVLALVVSGVVASPPVRITLVRPLPGSPPPRLRVTFGVAVMLGKIGNKFSNITGGADGLQG